MQTNIQALRGFFQPKSYIHRLTSQEQTSIKPIIVKLSFLLLVSLVVSILYSLMGYGTEVISKGLADYSTSEIAALQTFHTVGLLLKGFFYPIFYLTLSVLLSYFFFRESSLIVYIHIHLYFIAFIMLNHVAQVFLFYTWGIPSISSPFSLGIVGQLLFNHPFLIHFMSYLNLFFIAGIVLLFILLNRISSKKPMINALIVVGIHLFLALLGAGISMINIDAMLR
ncbi:hypothetical protein ACOI1C_11455 [Bacillus sp. DJP31]|uniref:hypothetical protein n=1 Tax=Bacillus sp. DJP31 TaxID=3409789 RepID=UPI003BB5E6AE